jgi:hypothetical protein
MYQGNNSYVNSLEIGHEFQDFVVEKLAKQLGISISIFQSKKYQFTEGETLQGVEIKYDSRSTGDCTYKECTPTGNVGIEVSEKSNKNNLNWIPSGIYRRDNTWLYIVGNYQNIWIFGKKDLILLHEKNIYNVCQTLPTIKTMLLPISEADKLCLKKLIFTN